MIEPSTSQWSFPIVPVRKKDGSLRICIDYGKLNTLSVGDAYPMPRIDDLTTLDLAKGYWQVPLACVKTTFSSPLGLFQFTVMPFGLQETFQRLMDSVITGPNCCAAYLDNLIVVQTDHHALTWLHRLNRLKENNPRLSRWSLALQTYNFEVKYRVGKANGNADALSRAYTASNYFS